MSIEFTLGGAADFSGRSSSSHHVLRATSMDAAREEEDNLPFSASSLPLGFSIEGKAEKLSSLCELDGEQELSTVQGWLLGDTPRLFNWLVKYSALMRSSRDFLVWEDAVEDLGLYIMLPVMSRVEVGELMSP
mmetsp:Transcript_8853/g.54484  ORF Transcript_8853/g.54484 Transcript_8853/m.54484 type:complete len:133 (-) Transcript_8853:1042-1440(-)